MLCSIVMVKSQAYSTKNYHTHRSNNIESLHVMLCTVCTYNCMVLLSCQVVLV